LVVQHQLLLISLIHYVMSLGVQVPSRTTFLDVPHVHLGGVGVEGAGIRKSYLLTIDSHWLIVKEIVSW